MHSSGSMIYTIFERIHGLLDEAAVGAKWKDDYLIRHILTPSMVKVLARLHNTSSVRIIQTFDITLDDDQYYYKLPPCVQKVLRIVTLDNDGVAVDEVVPRDFMDWRGQSYRLEGNPGAWELYMEKRPVVVPTIQVWYVPNADSMPHYATAGDSSAYVFSGTGATWDEATMTLTSTGDFANYVWAEGDMLTISSATNGTIGDYEIATYNEDDNSVTLKTSPGSSASSIAWRTHAWYMDLDTTPTVGGLDRRENAYVGQYLNILPTSATTRQHSRLITASTWLGTKWRLTLRTPVDVGATPAAITYEIMPPLSSAMADAIAAQGAHTLAAYRKMPRHGFEMLREELRLSLKTLGDLFTNFEGRKGNYISRSSADRNLNVGYAFYLPE